MVLSRDALRVDERERSHSGGANGQVMAAPRVLTDSGKRAKRTRQL